MGIYLNYGTSKRINTELCMHQINSILKGKNSRKIMFLVPEQFSSYYEQILVDNSIENGSFHAEVVTFRRLSFRLFAKYLLSNDKYIDNAGKSILLYDIITKNSDDLKAFSKASSYPAFAGEILNSIREFKRYGVTPEVLCDAKDKMGNGLLKDKLNELMLFYNEYEQTLISENLNDADDNLKELAKLINIHTEITETEIFIDGFDGFTPAETEVITSLMAKGRNVSFFFCCESLENTDRTDVFYPVIKNIIKIQKASERLGLTIIENPIKAEGSALIERPGELDHLSKEYFNYPGRIYYGNCEAITLIGAKTIYEEVRRCALKISTLVRAGKMRYGDICIVSGNYEEYREYIDAVFSQYGIPVFLDEKRSIAKHPLASYIISLLDIYIEKYSIESVLNFLKSSYTSIDFDEIPLLENYIYQWNIKGKSTWCDNDWQKQPRQGKIDVLDKINSTRRKLTDITEPFFNKLSYGIEPDKFALELLHFLKENGILNKLKDEAKAAAEDGRLEFADEIKQSWNILMEILDQISVVTSGGKLTAEKYRDMLLLAFSQKKIGIIPPRIDTVFAGTIDKAYGIKNKMLMILGANDPGFPERIINEGLLTDRDRSSISQMGIEIAPDTKEQVMNSMIGVYNLLSLPLEKIYVSYSENGLDGAKKRKSVFFERVLNLFEKAKIEDSSDVQPSNYILTPIMGLDALEKTEELTMLRDMPSTGEYCNGDRPLCDINENSNQNSGLKRWLKENGYPIHNHFSRNEENSAAFKLIIQKLIGSSIITSPTDIENYVRCPFKYFSQNALRLNENIKYELSAPDLGNVIHSLLKDLISEYQDISIEEIDKSKNSIIKRTEEKLSETKTANLFKNDSRFEHLGKRTIERIFDAFKMIIGQLNAGDFRATEFETAFGSGNDAKELAFSTEEHTTFIKGRIDRVDTANIGEEEYFRIVDYKSSARELKLYRVKEGLDIQLPSYLMAYERKSGKKPAGMYYFSAKENIIPVDYDYEVNEVASMKFKKARLEGFTLSDPDIFKAMDNNFENNSEIIPVRYDKKNNRYKKTMTGKELEAMAHGVASVINEKTQNIYDCKFTAEPVNAEGAACDYCSYRSICGFDIKKAFNKYRQIEKVSDENVDWGWDEQD